MGVWQDIRTAGETARQNLWGTTVTYKDSEFPCEATSSEEALEEQRTNYLPKKPVIFSLQRTDFLTMQGMGMAPREVVESGGSRFQVYAIIDDPSDSTTDLRCTIKV